MTKPRYRVIVAFPIAAALSCSSSTKPESLNTGSAGAALSASDPVQPIALPPQVESWWVANGGNRYTALQYTSTRLLYANTVIHTVDGFDPSAHVPVRVCFEATGAVLPDCGDALSRSDAAQRKALYGVADDDLVAYMASDKTDAAISVGIWLHSEYVPVRLTDTNPSRQDVDNLRASKDAQVAAAVQAFKADLPKDFAAPLYFAPGAPAVYASLSKSEIDTIARLNTAAFVSRQLPYKASSTAYIGAVNATAGAYNGSGEDVCFIEAHQPAAPNSAPFGSAYCAGGTTDPHGGWVAGVVRDNLAPYGDAVGETSHIASWDGCDPNAAAAYNWCASYAFPVWNFSHTASPLDSALFDYWSLTYPYPTISLAAGNNDPIPPVACASSCSANTLSVSPTSYNAIIVGASNDCGTTSRSDDAIACFSNGTNPSTGRELPLLTAPGQSISTNGGVVNGTSFAAPAVAAAAAQLMQANASLKVYPEAIRAIIMNGADEQLENFTTHSSQDFRGGVGELNILTSLNIAANRYGGTALARGFDFGQWASSSTPANSYVTTVWHAQSTVAGTMSVVLAWDPVVSCTSPGTPASAHCMTPAPAGNFYLYVFRSSDGALMQYGTTTGNAFQTFQFPAAANTDYQIRVWASSWSGSSTWFGLSWNIGTYSLSSNYLP